MPSSLVVLIGNEKLDVCSKTLGHYVVHFVLLQIQKSWAIYFLIAFFMSTESELIARIRELETELKKTKKSKRYGLVWEDKPEDIVERCKDELPVLIEDTTKRILEWWDDLMHILIEWDNYHALSVLAYTHEKKIDVIYIDPPYNTGNKDFSYNDNYVDKEDSFRHSKWVSFMESRLVIAKSLLKESWVIFISIDDNEQAQLKILCDDIFWENCHIGSLVWRRRASSNLAEKMLSTDHEYVHCYGKDRFKFIWLVKNFDKYSNPDDDARWPWIAGDLTVGMGKDLRPNQFYSLIDPKTNISYPANPNRVWAYAPSSMERIILEERVIFPSDPKKRPMLKRFQNELKTDTNPVSTWLTDVWLNSEASREIQNMFGENVFQYWKPKSLLKYLIKTSAHQDSIILDFFAWSGTTCHAVLELNKEDGGKRQCILVTNNENQIAEEVTYPRIRNVISGYADVEAISANLRYYRTDFIWVDKSIDDLRSKFMGRCTEMLQIRENCFREIAHEWASEYFQIFENSGTILAILYHPYEIEKLKKFAEGRDTTIIVYIFSMGWEIFEEELAHLSDRIRIETIPDEILETYKKIFGF